MWCHANESDKSCNLKRWPYYQSALVFSNASAWPGENKSTCIAAAAAVLVFLYLIKNKHSGCEVNKMQGKGGKGIIWCHYVFVAKYTFKIQWNLITMQQQCCLYRIYKLNLTGVCLLNTWSLDENNYWQSEWTIWISAPGDWHFIDI